MKILARLRKGAPHLCVAAIASVTIAGALTIYQSFSGSVNQTEITPFPNMISSAPRLQSVRILTPECDTNLLKKSDKWTLSAGRDYPASEDSTLAFFRDLSEWKLIEKRKAGAGVYEKLHLNNPIRSGAVAENSSEGIGSRITITDGRGKIAADFIIGKRVASYPGGAVKRFYFRHTEGSDIYVAEAKRYPNLCAGDFLTADLGLPPFQKVTRIESYKGEKKQFALERVGSDKKGSFFTPVGLPSHLRLIYPNAANDFVQILTEKIRPLSIYRIPKEKPLNAVGSAIMFYTATEAPVRVEFWKEGDFHFMNFMGTDQAFNNQTLYRISEETFNILSQPLAPLLTLRAGEGQNQAAPAN